MITPNKFISFEQSVLSKLPSLLVDKSRIGIHELYSEVADRFESVDQFMLALDVLYILNKIDIDFHSGVVSYAD
ncbi:hypothetical protein GSY71_10295 [Pusillimonas sp. TS35]|uniref:ABC-three component system middle component 7 n=1 Tax=Paracandidimonas lactea TaxID=2895524 RepID=UPI00136A09D2|nr:ABC-three component system middle component 7 [Paracandidimonas lactea]MYN13524.1 hypothetical protein [Pusillimonas sp. TS35]